MSRASLGNFSCVLKSLLQERRSDRRAAAKIVTDGAPASFYHFVTSSCTIIAEGLFCGHCDFQESKIGRVRHMNPVMAGGLVGWWAGGLQV